MSVEDDCSLVAILMVGECKACSAHYFVVETFVMREGPDVPFEYSLGYRDVRGFKHAMASMDDLAAPPTWLVTLCDTADGQLQKHEFGPFKLERIDDVRGPYGVASCEEAGHRKPWADSSALVERLRPHLYELCRALADGNG